MKASYKTKREKQIHRRETSNIIGSASVSFQMPTSVMRDLALSSWPVSQRRALDISVTQTARKHDPPSADPDSLPTPLNTSFEFGQTTERHTQSSSVTRRFRNLHTCTGSQNPRILARRTPTSTGTTPRGRRPQAEDSLLQTLHTCGAWPVGHDYICSNISKGHTASIFRITRNNTVSKSAAK
jgi:hypothetical protein